jgi:predicted AAA+ superfamily ATPase
MRTHPVVAIMGSRQTGKSTLVQTLPALADYDYVTLDDLEIRGQARSAPDDLVHRAPRLVIDEVQREPNLVLALKSAIDRQRPRTPGRFVLTGSANLLLMKRISETLAGRAVYVPIWPLTHREQMGSGAAGIWSELLATPVEGWYDLVRSQDTAAEDWRALARRGGYPTPSVELREDEDRTLWFSGYVTTYLERDLQDLSAIENLADFRRLMRLAALRIGTVMNQAMLARDAGLPPATAHRYLNLLETSYQLIRLEPYAVNRTKRLVKSPRIFWNDPGLAMFLAGESEAGGAHFENLILADLIAWRDVQVSRPQILYWRTASGAEVDFVIEHEGGLLAIEAKSGTRVGHDDAKSIREFREEYGRAFRGGLVLYSGSETFWLSEGILAAPWWRVF